MMTFFFGQGTHIVRELKGVDKVRERKVPFEALDLISSDKRPLRHLGMKLTAFLGRDSGGSSLAGLTLHFH
jgi:hypothetical protein